MYPQFLVRTVFTRIPLSRPRVLYVPKARNVRQQVRNQLRVLLDNLVRLEIAHAPCALQDTSVLMVSLTIQYITGLGSDYNNNYNLRGGIGQSESLTSGLTAINLLKLLLKILCDGMAEGIECHFGSWIITIFITFVRKDFYYMRR